MNELALFAGAGGGILGGSLIGWRTVCAVEVNTYCCRRLMQRQNEGHLPPFPIWDDVCSFDGRQWRGAIDVVSGGFPCQAFSTAARGRNTARDLWPEMRRIISEVEPPYVFAENVAARAIERAALDCEEMGYKTDLLSLSAADLGADHKRRRFWLLAHTDDKAKLRRSINAETCRMPSVHGSVWETDPFSTGVADGVADRMERITAVGNGQVPIVAAAAVWALSEAGDHEPRKERL